MGGIEKSIIQQCIQSREEFPERIKNKPTLDPYLEFYYKAFIDLDRERSHVMGATYIPWSSVINYARFCGLDREDTEDLLFFIRAMDDVVVNRINKRLAQKTKN